MFRYKSILISISSILILFILINYIVGFDGLYGQDSYEYLRYTKALHTYLITGKHPGDYFWPLYYPIVGSILSFLIESQIALQLISIMSLIISSLYIIKIIKLLYGKKYNSNIYVLIIFTLSPIVFRLSVLSMSDMFSTSLIILSFYNAIIFFRKNSTKNLYLVLLFSISAIMTRYVAFVVLLPLGISILYIVIRNKNHLKHIPILVVLGILLLLPHFIIRSKNTTQFLNHDWLTNWSFINFFKRSFTTLDGTSYNTFPNIIYGFSSLFHPRYLLIGILLISLYYKAKIITPEIKILLISFLIYSFFLAGIPFQNTRFLLLSFPLAVIILYPSFIYLIEKIKPLKKQKYVILSLLLIQSCLITYSMKPIIERNSLEKNIASQLINYQKNTLYSFDIDIAIQGRSLDFNYKNLWIKKYLTFENDALVLFHPTKFEQQWKGKNPILNWDNLKDNYDLITIKELSEGWMLYKIKNKK